MKIVLVTWTDAYSFDDWKSKTEIEARLKDSPCGMMTLTPGFLFEESENNISLIQNFQPPTPESDEDYSGLLVIPKGMVQSVEILKDE